MSTSIGTPALQPPNRALDVLRGTAALLVVLGHARVFLFRGFEIRLDSIGPLQRILLAPSSFAQESVAIFFVLSGFLVGGQVLRDVGADRFSWRGYLAKRLSRLWTVLLPGPLLTLGLDTLSGRFPHFSLLGTLPLDADSFLCNLAFLQQSRCGWYGSNESLWSLAFEFWFYILFAASTVIVFAAARRRWTRAVIGAAIAALVLVAFGPDLLRLLPSWLLGVGVAVVVRRRSRRQAPHPPLARRTRAVASAVALLLVGMLVSNVFLGEETPLTQLARFALVGGAAAPLVAELAVHRPANESRLVRVLAASGAWSYSSYVFHAPILKLVVVVLMATSFAGEGPLTVITVYALAALGYFLTIPLWAITERHTARVRDLLLTVLRVQPRGPSSAGTRTR